MLYLQITSTMFPGVYVFPCTALIDATAFLLMSNCEKIGI